MIKQLNLNRCKTFIALLLVLCNLLSIFGGIVSFNSTSIYALTQEDWYRFYKVDEEGNPVVGAQLQLLDSAGNILDEWETDGSPHDFYFFNLDANGLSYDGTLILKEVSAPEGYQIAEDIIVDPANITPILDPDEEFIMGYCYMVYMIDPKAVEVPEDENLPEILKPEDSNPNINTDLSTELEEVEEGEDIVITFTNELETIQNLTVTKEVKEEQADGSWLDYETDETFEFNIKFSGMAEGTSFSSTIGRVTADEYGEAYKTFYLKNGENAEFFDLPIGVEYIVEESANPYKPSYMVTGIDVVKNSDEATKGSKLSTRIESIELNEQAEVIFTNVSIPEGTLVIKKEVDGKIANPNEKFEFTITLSGNKIGGNQEFNGVTFTDGIATIELAADEEMTFELPAGTTYEVVEKEYEDYDTTHDKQVVDPYSVNPTITGENFSANVKFHVYKVDEDNNPIEGVQFKVKNIYKYSDGSEEYDYYAFDEWVSTDTYFEMDLCMIGTLDNLIEAEMYSKDIEIIEVEAPEGYKLAEPVRINYEDIFGDLTPKEVKEKFINGEWSDYVSGNAFATNGTYPEPIEVRVVNYPLEDGETPEPESPKTIGTITKNIYDVVTVTNTYNIPTQDLTISKLVKEEQMDGNMVEINNDTHYSFHIYLENMPANYTFADSYGRNYTSNDEGKVVVDFSLTNGEEVKIFGLPVGTKYRVEEVLSNAEKFEGMQPSYQIIGLNTVKNADKGENGGDLSTEFETIDEGEESSVIFTNTLTMARGKLVVEKKMEGAGNPDEYFEFNITLSGSHISGSQVINGQTFVDGNATVRLKAGESKEFDLPVGTGYHVVETENEMYEVSYEKQVIDAYGVMPMGSNIDEGFWMTVHVNKVDEDGNPVVSANLQLVTDTGVVLEEWISDGTIFETGFFVGGDPWDNGGTTVDEEALVYVREVSAPDGYKVAEDIFLDPDKTDLWEYGGEELYGWNITMVDESEEIIEDGEIPEPDSPPAPEIPEIGENGTITENYCDVITVTNTLITSNITLKKNVTNIETSAKFTINAEFANLMPNATYELSNGAKMTADAAGNASYTAQLGHGEEIVFKDIPLNATYKFTEIAGEYIASYKIIDNNKN